MPALLLAIFVTVCEVGYPIFGSSRVAVVLDKLSCLVVGIVVELIIFLLGACASYIRSDALKHRR